MSSLIPRGGFQLPFQKRLSRLYNDTKKSSDFVKEAPQHAEDDPEIKALHRKLRIQKDRLVTWGVEWTDHSSPSSSALPGGGSGSGSASGSGSGGVGGKDGGVKDPAEIDESLSRAGLSELVGSIMSTIKDILAEAEPLWQSYKGRPSTSTTSTSGKGAGGGGSGADQKKPLITWDRGRFEDLVRDLTMSIDTLYDLSRTRSTTAMAFRAASGMAGTSTASRSGEETKIFESTRMQTPQQIDPASLTPLRDMHPDAKRDPVWFPRIPRENKTEIVFMSKQAFSDLTGASQPWAPLLLEFAPFDPIYSSTGIMPPMSRFERLSSGLQSGPQRSPGTWTGLPRLLGYFEDMEQSRLGLVYQFPLAFNPVSFETPSSPPVPRFVTLSRLLGRVGYEPRLEAKFRLAHNLANTVFDMHARGIAHGNLSASSIAFCTAVPEDPQTYGEPDVRRPLVTSFDLFSGPEQDTSIYQAMYGPDPPTNVPGAERAHPLSGRPIDARAMDLRALASVLGEIGLWGAKDVSTHAAVSERLAAQCGTLYMKAYQACWDAVEQEISGQCTGEELLASVQVHVSRCLEACCIIDGVSGLEHRVREDSPGPEGSSSWEYSMGSGHRESTRGGSTHGAAKEKPSALPKREEANPAPKEVVPDAKLEPEQPPAPQQPPPGPKHERLRLYPQVALPADAVDRWNKVVMPMVNNALRSFYRKHPESVEISLEAIGTTAQSTKPTVLVVCTSVGKVRSILCRKMADLFECSSGSAASGGGEFGLKVCRGKVIRARKQGGYAREWSWPNRSMGEEGRGGVDDEPANGAFQERPGNGASIGAWIGDRHLPPVSLGGLVIVDDKPYGMTVHHMLDDPDCNDNTHEAAPLFRSSGRAQAWYGQSSSESSDGEDFACEFSDSDEEYSDTEPTSDDSDLDSDDSGSEDDEDGEYNEPGDIPGIEPGCGDGYIITQPAFDDVGEAFHPSADTEDEDHLDSFGLGEMYASSGIRRRLEGGLVHEVDWALFEFQSGRLPQTNLIPRSSSSSHTSMSTPGPRDGVPDGEMKEEERLNPTTVASAESLPGLEVQCVARTSGVQTGRIMPALTSVKIYGRTSPSHAYQVSTTSSPTQPPSAQGDESCTSRRLGVPGDSGAWVVDKRDGRVCGHVLAWSQRKQVSYICPMDVLLLDIAETLSACEVKLPGGEAIVTRAALGGEWEKVGARVTNLELGVEGASENSGDEEEEEDEEEEAARDKEDVAGSPRGARGVESEKVGFEDIRYMAGKVEGDVPSAMSSPKLLVAECAR